MRLTPRIPRLAATIDRRLLVNYRMDPLAARRLLPGGMSPVLVDGDAVAGICVLRLTHVWPSPLRPGFGWGAENVAHRIAVQWKAADGHTARGVYIPQRHSASPLTVLAGGRIFPGVHKRARFRVDESAQRIQVDIEAEDMTVAVDVRVADPLSATPPHWSSTLFETVDDASAFFEAGAVGWSPSRSGRSLQGLRLSTDAWQVESGEVDHVHSSFFDALPAGTAELDNVLVMRKVPVTWSNAGERVA